MYSYFLFSYILNPVYTLFKFHLGGYGFVYVAVDTAGKEYAIKVSHTYLFTCNLFTRLHVI